MEGYDVPPKLVEERQNLETTIAGLRRRLKAMEVSSLHVVPYLNFNVQRNGFSSFCRFVSHLAILIPERKWRLCLKKCAIKSIKVSDVTSFLRVSLVKSLVIFQ